SLLGSADESAWLYRVSKAALNMAVASACQQWPGLTLLALDPGWTQTDMGGPGAIVPLADSVQGLMNVLAQVQPEDRGSLWRYDGTKTELLGA
ncbi:MAG: short chain dehydrogenase, partial [Comamonas sp.]